MHATAEAPPVVTASGKPINPNRTRERRICTLEMWQESADVSIAPRWISVGTFADETAAKKHVRDEELEGRFRTVLIGAEFTAAKVTKTTVRLS